MARARHKETEIKLRVKDTAALLRRIRTAGGRKLSRVFERNVLFDCPGGKLWTRDALLRLRCEFNAPRGTRVPAKDARCVSAWLTYKGKGNESGRYKTRDEIECAVGDAEQMTGILEAIGLAGSFRYEKFRTTFKLRGIARVAVELDETPIGVFLELEGERGSIDRAARALGFSARDYIQESYWALYREFCTAHRRPLRDMVFSAQKR